MFYVYAKHVGSGKEHFIGVFETMKEAVGNIASNYKIDEQIGQKNEYYYFMKQH